MSNTELTGAQNQPRKVRLVSSDQVDILLTRVQDVFGEVFSQRQMIEKAAGVILPEPTLERYHQDSLNFIASWSGEDGIERNLGATVMETEDVILTYNLK